jgi:hypothetical protein
MANEIETLHAARERAVEVRRKIADAMSKIPRNPGSREDPFERYRTWFMDTQALIEAIDAAIDDEESHTD